MEFRGMTWMAACAALVLLWHCDMPKNPKAPSWDTQFALPLADYVFGFSRLGGGGTDSLLVVRDGVYHVVYQHQIGRTEIGGGLKIEAPGSVAVSQTIGLVRVGPATSRTPIALGEVTEYASQTDGQSLVVPELDFSLDKDLASFGEFRGVHVVDGYADITLENHTAIQIGSPVTLALRNRGDQGPVGGVTFDEPILPGGQATRRLDLTDTMVSGDLALEISGHSAGSRGEIVTVYADSVLVVEVSIPTVTVSEAEAKLPALEFSAVGAAVLEDSTRVFGGRISRGGFLVEVESQLLVDCEAVLTIPALTLDGAAFAQTIVLHRDNPTWTERVDLAGYQMGPPDEGGAALDSLRYVLAVRTVDTTQDSDPGTDYGTIRHTDSVSLGLTFEPIWFSYLRGEFLRPYVIPITQKEFPIEQALMDIEGPDAGWITFQRADFAITMSWSERFAVPTSVVLKIEGIGRRQDRSEVYQSAQGGGDIDPAHPDFLVRAEDILAALPDTVRIGGLARFQGRVEVWEDSYLDGVANLDAPLTVRVKQTQLELGKVRKEKVPYELQQAATRGDIRRVGVFAEIENHSPLSGRMLMLISPSPASFDSGATAEALAEIDSLFEQVLPRPILDSDGEIAQSGAVVDSLVLDSAKFDVLGHRTIYIRSRVILDATETPQGEEVFVSVKPSHFVHFKAHLEADVRVDIEAMR